MSTIELSENHRRSISITLQLVDKALCEWSDWCDGRVQSGVLFREEDTLSDSQKTELRNQIAAIRQLMLRLRDDLSLSVKTIFTARSVATHSSLLWEMLTELNSRQLQAFGWVPENLGRYLDPVGQQLTQQMNAITALLSETHS